MKIVSVVRSRRNPGMLLTLVLCAALRTGVVGCINDYEPNHRTEVRSKGIVHSLTEHHLQEPWSERRDRLRKRVATSTDYRVRNDLAVALLHTGEIEEAIAILKRIEAEHPGAYQTAANLGTAYELAGRNGEALTWIQKGIERYPHAHGGSEWIHVAILKAKIALASDPDWLKTHSVIGLDFGSENHPSVPASLPRGVNNAPQTLDEVREALQTQLHERLQFVEAPDSMVGDLLMDLGNLWALGPDGIAASAGVYELAQSYAPSQADLAQRRLQTAQRALAQKSRRGWTEETRIQVMLVAVPISVLLVVWMFLRSNRKKPEAAGA